MINRSFNRQLGNFGKSLIRLNSQIGRIHSSPNFISIQLPLPASKIAKKVIMSKYSLARKPFGLEESDSDDSERSVIYISSSEDKSSEWETDCSTDTEQLVARIEREVTSSPMLIGGRIMTVDEPTEDEPEAGPSSSQTQTDVTPRLDHKYFDNEMCYAPPKKTGKSRIELCKTLLPVPESPMSPPDHERGLSMDTPLCSLSCEVFTPLTMCKTQGLTRMSVRNYILDAWFVEDLRRRSKGRKWSGMLPDLSPEESLNT